MNMVKNKEVSIEGALHLAQKEGYADKVRSLFDLFCKPSKCTSTFWKAWLNVRACLSCFQSCSLPLCANTPVHDQMCLAKMDVFYPMDVSCRCCGYIHVLFIPG